MIPENWPTPGNPLTRLRVNLMKIPVPMDTTPMLPNEPPRPRGITSVLEINFTEATEVGNSFFEIPRPEFSISSSLVALMNHKDPEVRQAIQAVAWGLEIIDYALYLEVVDRYEKSLISPLVPIIPE